MPAKISDAYHPTARVFTHQGPPFIMRQTTGSAKGTEIYLKRSWSRKHSQADRPPYHAFESYLSNISDPVKLGRRNSMAIPRFAEKKQKQSGTIKFLTAVPKAILPEVEQNTI